MKLHSSLITSLTMIVAGTALAFSPGPHAIGAGSGRRSALSPRMVTGQQASSFGPASLLRKLKEDVPQFPWLAEGSGNPNNKVDMPEHVKVVLAQPEAPKREAESEERTHRIRTRFQEAAADAKALRGMLVGEDDLSAWWRTQRQIPVGGRAVTKEDPLTVLVAGGGLAGLVTASACHALGMKVAIFEQAPAHARKPALAPTHSHRTPVHPTSRPAPRVPRRPVPLSEALRPPLRSRRRRTRRTEDQSRSSRMPCARSSGSRRRCTKSWSPRARARRTACRASRSAIRRGTSSLACTTGAIGSCGSIRSDR